jgi:proline iminopeptidase
MKKTLFPDIEPEQQGLLDVGNGHRLHWQASGNPQGKPVVWLHGGPGASASRAHRRFLNPEKFWIIQFDQRGCGQSQSRGEIQANRTSDLVEDIERLRGIFDIQRWSVIGGSWGGALALLYAQAYPSAVERMLLRSPFLCTTAEISGYTESLHGFASCHELWRQIRALMPAGATQNVLEFSHRIFCQSNDAALQAELARAWIAYETALGALPASATVPGSLDVNALIARYRIQTHYLQNGCFVKPPILKRPEVLQGLDLTLVHGEQDALCPFENSLLIQRIAPQARLVRVPSAGHDLFASGMLQALVQAIAGWESNEVIG